MTTNSQMFRTLWDALVLVRAVQMIISEAINKETRRRDGEGGVLEVLRKKYMWKCVKLNNLCTITNIFHYYIMYSTESA